MDIVKTKIPKIIGVKPIGQLSLLVMYENKDMKKFDVKPYLEQFSAFAPLADERVFNQVRTNGLGTALIWNSEIDISGYDVWEAGISRTNI